MPMQTALLGFASFRSIQHRLSKSLSPAETTIIEIIAGALGLAPFTSGFTGLIPALEFLTTPAENGPKRFSVVQLLWNSLATCALGIVVAAPFRQLFILRDRLRYPSATATGILIGVLFGKETIVARAQQSEIRVSGSHHSEADTDSDPPEATGRNEVRLADPAFSNDLGVGFVQGDVGRAVNVLLVSLAGSSLFSLVSYFIPILRNVPIFGHTVAKDWLWAFDLSPAYLGYGIIIGPSVNAGILLGAIVGWGILSPVAKHNGWAAGPVGDWDNGSRGWILWVGMGLILGDSAVGLSWAIFKPLIPWAQRRLRARRLKISRSQEMGEQNPLLHDRLNTHRKDDMVDSAVDDNWPTSSLVTPSLILWTSAALLFLYLVSLLGVFRTLLPLPATLIALILVPLGGFVSMRSLGETDDGAALAIGRMAQFIIALLVPASNPNYISANVLLGGVVEAGASQASQQMGGLKTAYMTKTPPRVVYYSQIIGSLAGTLVATLVYRIYTSLKKIPSEEFGIPDAHIWLVAARLIYQQTLPPRVLAFAIAAFVIGAVFSVLRILGSNRWWRDLVPSGEQWPLVRSAFPSSLLNSDECLPNLLTCPDMYIVPAITLLRALGSLILVIGRDRFNIKSFVLLCSATGLILGQGIFSLIALLFDAVHVPHF
ncbi:MAG: hypothetical protein M1839_007177 [Geoglossum umbratile]|nr:MAG: hypothetical protein M1839_007177 [Geoglossum umbratile]